MCTVGFSLCEEQNLNEANFSRVAVVARRQDSSIAETVLALSDVLKNLGAELVFEEQTAASLAEFCASNTLQVVPRPQIAAESDLVVVVGGDGSLLGVSRDVQQSGVPIVGVNRGGLGFLAAVSPEKLDESFASIWAGEYTLEDHFFLRAEIQHADGLSAEATALNDVVLQPGNTSRMIEFELWVDDEFVYQQRSDGVIVASPTGSTAYSLSERC